MTQQQRTSLLALLALLLCSSCSSSSSSSASTSASSEARNSSDERLLPGHNQGSDSALLSGGFGPGPVEAVSPVCAYRVIEGGISGQLCFRLTALGYKCLKEDCRTRVSLGTLVANILLNGSVLLQWTHEGDRDADADPGPGPTLSSPLFGARRHRRGGYELSCWWNGSYTQFECASVRLGSGCRDFLLSELHENIPYRFCLRPLTRSEPDLMGAELPSWDCVEFTLPTSGMQDIVIAMTTVGGAICVMLVIICLLVAYITENIMSPATQHAYSYRAHPRH